MQHYPIIVCRHLALAYLSHHKRKSRQSYHHTFSSQQSISQSMLSHNMLDHYQINARADWMRHFHIDSYEFGTTLHEASLSMKPGEQKTFIFDSSNHAMAIVLLYKHDEKGKRFVLKFFDPNKTLKHLRFVTERSQALRALSIHHFLSKRDIEHYFDRSFYASIREYTNLETPHEQPLLTKVDYNHDIDLSSVKSLLRRVAIVPDIETMQACIDFIQHQKISDSSKGDLMSAHEVCKASILYLCMWFNNVDGVKLVMNTINHLRINDKQLLSLLCPSTSRQRQINPSVTHTRTGLTEALSAGHTDVVTTYMALLFQSKLSAASLTQALINSRAGLTAAINHNQVNTVKAYVDLVLNGPLSANSLVKSLTVRAKILTPDQPPSAAIYAYLTAIHQSTLSYSRKRQLFWRAGVRTVATYQHLFPGVSRPLFRERASQQRFFKIPSKRNAPPPPSPPPAAPEPNELAGSGGGSGAKRSRQPV